MKSNLSIVVVVIVVLALTSRQDIPQPLHDIADMSKQWGDKAKLYTGLPTGNLSESCRCSRNSYAVPAYVNCLARDERGIYYIAQQVYSWKLRGKRMFVLVFQCDRERGVSLQILPRTSYFSKLSCRLSTLPYTMAPTVARAANTPATNHRGTAAVSPKQTKGRHATPEQTSKRANEQADKRASGQASKRTSEQDGSSSSSSSSSQDNDGNDDDDNDHSGRREETSLEDGTAGRR